MKILTFLTLTFLLSCQGGARKPLSVEPTSSSWPVSLEKVILYCSHDSQKIEITPKNFQALHDCQDLPGASEVELVFKDKPQANRVIVKAQTVGHVTLMNEGPHVDLTNWKSVTSEMLPLEATKGRYQLKKEKFKTFPTFTNKELKEATLKELKSWGGKPNLQWLELAEKCGTDPNKYPCGVGTSEFRLQIEVPEDDFVLKLRVAVPMGC